MTKTLVNFLAWKIFLEQKFLLQKGALRNLIDIEDVRDLLELAIPHAEKLNLISFALPHSTEVSIIVDFLVVRFIGQKYKFDEL